MKRFLATTFSMPLWLMLTLLAGVAAQNHFLYSNAVEAWRLKERAELNARACDDYLQPGVRFSNLSTAQQSHYDQCFKIQQQGGHL